MQQLDGLVSLRALHIIQLRNDDTCVWVMRETKRFLIDNLSHYPDLKLEWISIDEDCLAERIVRPSEAPKKSEKAKGKEKATNLTNGSGNGGFPILPLDTWDTPSEDSDDDDDPLKLETFDNVHFSDVWGVKIFKKEITSGRI